MPVPQENSSLVEQASCLFIKGLRMVQHMSYTQPRARYSSRIIENCYIKTYRRKTRFYNNIRFGNEAFMKKPGF
ncbi:hypothetical protein [Microcoleus sp. D2_18a_D3]|uniref:hypothetical protein n=1 Tax=Microcoleus sp. D2_18a_D3 TaxID=3055330 RepID=UPI002FD2BA5A